MSLERKWTPRTAKCLMCGEEHHFTRPKEFWECKCENHAMHDSGDEYYSRSGAIHPDKLLINDTPQSFLKEYAKERQDPNYFNKIRLRKISARLDEIDEMQQDLSRELVDLVDEREELEKMINAS